MSLVSTPSSPLDGCSPRVCACGSQVVESRVREPRSSPLHSHSRNIKNTDAVAHFYFLDCQARHQTVQTLISDRKPQWTNLYVTDLSDLDQCTIRYCLSKYSHNILLSVLHVSAISHLGLLMLMLTPTWTLVTSLYLDLIFRSRRPSATSCRLLASCSLRTASPEINPADQIPSSSSINSTSALTSPGHPPPLHLPQLFTSQTTLVLSSGQDAGTEYRKIPGNIRGSEVVQPHKPTRTASIPDGVTSVLVGTISDMYRC